MTLLCVATAWLALLTDPSSTNSPPIWPPVGIGLVAVLVFGRRMSACVFCSTLFVLLLDTQRYHAAAFPLPALVGGIVILSAVYTVQALFGAWCVRGILGHKLELLRVRDIGVFLVVAGPVQCVLAPTVGVGIGCFFQIRTWDEYLASWWMSYSADMLGGIFFAPLTLTFFGHPRDLWAKRIGSVGIPLSIAVTLTAGGFLVARNWELNEAENRIRQEIALSVREIRSEVRELENAMVRFQSLSQKDLLYSRHDRNLEHGQLKLLRDYVPWVASATGVVVIPQDYRRKFELAEGKAPVRITETGPTGTAAPAGNRDVYYVAVGSVPADDRVPVGHDLSTDPRWAALLGRAAASGLVEVSDIDYSANRPLVRVVTPCFKLLNGDIPLVTRPRTLSVYGFIAIEADLAHLVDDINKSLGGQLTVRLSRPDLPSAVAPGGYRVTEQFSIANQPVQVEAIASVEYMSAHRPRYATVAGLVGVVLTVMLTALVLMATGRTALVEGEVRHRMADIEQEIQHRKSVEASLRASEARLTEAQRITQLGYWEWKPDLDEMYWSPVLATMLGVLGSDRIFKLEDLMVRVHPDDRKFLLSTIETMPQLQRTAQLEYRILRMDGVIRWFSATITTSRSEHGGVVRGTVLEVTERKRAESALHDGKARLRLALDSAGMGTWEWHVGTQRLLWDAREQEIFGFKPGEFDEKLSTFYSRVHPDDRPAVEHKLNDAVRSGEPLSGEFRIVYPTGEILWVAAHGQILNASEGHAARVIGINFDITKRKQAELLLRNSEANLAEAQRIAKIGSFEWYPKTNQRWWSDEMFRVLGYEPHSIRPSFELFLARVHPADRDVVTDSLQGTLFEGKPYSFEYRAVHPDGSVRHIRVSAIITRDASGAAVHFHGTHQDITEQKRIEESLRASEARLAEAQRMARLGHWETDPVANTFWGSDEIYRLLGLPPERVISREVIYEYVHPDDRQAMRAAFDRAVSTGGLVQLEHRFIRPDGQVRHFSVHAKVVRDDDRVRIIGTSQDVTAQKLEEEQKRVFEEQLQQTQKLESLGILAGGVAHDFNNLLTGILGNASLVRELIPAESELQEYLRPIEKSAEHAAQLCHQMLTYAGKGNTVQCAVDLNVLIDESRDLLRLATSKKTALQLELAGHVPPLEGDPSQLRQVLLNLVQNASEAMGSHGGTITVRTGVTSTPPRHGEDTTCSGEHVLQESVWLEIADNGCGMDEATRTRIFEPFFTTKFTGRGLGLSAVHGIIRGHAGTICVTSQPNVGTTFHIHLPCQREPVAHDTGVLRDTPRPVSWTDTNTMIALVADDEKTIRSLAAVALRGLGFRVMEAQDGQEALDLFQEYPDQFRFVLLDVMMPGKDGREVLGRIHALRPDLPVVLMSGYNEYDIGDIGENRNVIYLQKPFRAADLSSCIRRVLGRTVSTVG